MGWRTDSTQNRQRTDDHKFGVMNLRFGLHQQGVQLGAVQENSRIKKEKGVFCIMPSARRSEALSTFCLKKSVSADATTPDQNRM